MSTSTLIDSPALLYASRPEWEDVVPLEQYEDLDGPLAPIMYNEDYKDVTSYLRAIVKSGEKSQRVLDLTESVIRLNPGHYTAWQYRYETLVAIDAPLDIEVLLMDELAVKFLKTYQVWHHRRLLLLRNLEQNPANPLGPVRRELEFIQQGLKDDTKNYHTWSYRQWILASLAMNEEFGDIWIGELDYTETMINNDVRNNSAWHHHFFVVWKSHTLTETEQERVLKRELIFTKQIISLAPNNASAWNYLRGVLDITKTPYATIRSFIQLYTLSSSNDSTGDIVDLENPGPGQGATLPCVAAVEFLADICEQEREKDKAKELWTSLAELDPIRKKYWGYRSRSFV